MDLQETITTEETTEEATEETTEETQDEVAMPDAVFTYDDYKQIKTFVEKKMVDGYTEEQAFEEYFN